MRWCSLTILLLLPLADGLRPTLLARPTSRPALLVARPTMCMTYAGQPPRQSSAGLFLSAGGLVTTIGASTFALSASGTIAILAASAAGLFSFKLSKELNNRGVRSKEVAKHVVGSTADLTLRVGFGLASVLVYTMAAAVSLIVLLLTKLSEATLSIAGVASRLKPSPLPPMSRAEADYRALQQARYAPIAAAAPAEPAYAPPPEPVYAPQPAAEMLPPPPQQQQQQQGGWYQPRQAPPSQEESLSTMGQRLAVEQMLARSRNAASAARKVEAEKAGLLKERQAEASSLVLEVPRPLAPISPPSRPHLAPILTTAAARVLLEVDNRAPYLAGRYDR